MSRSESLKRYWEAVRADPDKMNSRGKRRATKTVEERFWEKVDKSGECWVWTGAKLKGGRSYPYGIIRIEGKNVYAHRLAWEMENGTLERGSHVMHTCDNPSCVRVDHMKIGTHQQNMQDRDDKGRQAHGERVHTAKLTEEDRSAIMVMRKRGMTQQAIANVFGVRQGTISFLLNGKTWKH